MSRMQHRSECLANAADCRRKADAATSPTFVVFYEELEARWLKMVDEPPEVIAAQARLGAKSEPAGDA